MRFARAVAFLLNIFFTSQKIQNRSLKNKRRFTFAYSLPISKLLVRVQMRGKKKSSSLRAKASEKNHLQFRPFMVSVKVSTLTLYLAMIHSFIHITKRRKRKKMFCILYASRLCLLNQAFGSTRTERMITKGVK